MINKETGVEVAPENAWPEVVDRPGSGSASANRLDHLSGIQSCRGGIQKALTNANHIGSNQNLVHHLGVLTSAGAAMPNHDLPKQAKDWFGTSERCRLATSRDRKRCVSCPNIAATDRGVNAHDVSRAGMIGDHAHRHAFV